MSKLVYVVVEPPVVYDEFDEDSMVWHGIFLDEAEAQAVSKKYPGAEIFTFTLNEECSRYGI